MTSVRFGLAIDPVTDDLFLRSDGNLATVSDAEAVGQHVRQRLTTFSGEWFLDKTAGVPWLDDILGKAYDPALAESVVKAEILNTDGVTEITSFSVSFDKATRGLIIKSVEVGTIFDTEVQA
ncbi:hypothetical protein [Rhizobium sp. F40D2]|uniref:hypothetical protein n=1 Tax=Rhizobium sp. F40D2 TaxID=3453141 RepID=UPI003F2242AB